MLPLVEIDGDYMTCRRALSILEATIRRRNHLTILAPMSFKQEAESMKKYLKPMMEQYEQFPAWTRNQSLIDYLTSEDPSLFLIGYTLLKQDPSYGNNRDTD